MTVNPITGATVEMVSHVAGGVAGAPDSVADSTVREEAKAFAAGFGKINLDLLEARTAEMRRVIDTFDAKTATRAELTRAEGVLGDLGATGELVVNKQVVEMMQEQRQPLPFAIAKHLRAVQWGQYVDATLEVSNLGLDLAFIVVELWPAHLELFAAATACLVLSMLVRLWAGLQERSEVDWKTKKRLYLRGLLVSLVEPFWGGRMIKRAFKRSAKSGTQVWDVAKNAYVDDDRDPLAVQAENDVAATKAEMLISLVLVLVEDVPGFAVQALFLAATEKGFSLRDPVLLLTVVTTLLHAWRQLAETWQMWCELPRLRGQAGGRHKVFDPATTTDEEVVAFAASEAAPHARKVVLKDCGGTTDSAVEKIAGGCSGLTSIILDNCSKITDSAVQQLAVGCPGLTSIRLQNCPKITDSAVEQLVACCPGLTAICLQECSRITDSAVQQLAARCPGLTYINLLSCQNITDSAVEQLAAGCPNLTSIFLADCPNITDSALQQIASCCHGLTTIYLWDCSNIMDSGVQQIATGCPGLTSISLSSCSNITDSAVQELAARCPGLTYVNLSGCPKITESAVQELKARCPGVKVRLG